MYHSLIISGKNTFSEWGMVPTSRPVINPPEVKTTHVDLPASHGVLDYTTLLLGEPPLGQRKGSWEFALKPGDNWIHVYASVMNYLHGKRHTIILEDDPLYQYIGRLSINSWKSDPAYSLITIDYNLDPFKYNVTPSDETDWLWNELFVEVIRYGRFTVSGTKYRNLINEGSLPTVPTFTCENPMTVKFGENTFSLVRGKNYNANLVLGPGDNIMLFTGNGDVSVSYREVSL